MGLIMVYFIYLILAPFIEQFKDGQSTSVQILTSLILPILMISFFIFIFKVFRRGEGGA